MEERDKRREHFFDAVDELEAAAEDLARAEPPLPMEAQATIFDDLNEIRHAGRAPDEEGATEPETKPED